jgi:hypothetical protein
MFIGVLHYHSKGNVATRHACLLLERPRIRKEGYLDLAGRCCVVLGLEERVLGVQQ